eukprot:2800399-Amphidinium_carterae.1
MALPRNEKTARPSILFAHLARNSQRDTLMGCHSFSNRWVLRVLSLFMELTTAYAHHTPTSSFTCMSVTLA